MLAAIFAGTLAERNTAPHKGVRGSPSRARGVVEYVTFAGVAAPPPSYPQEAGVAECLRAPRAG